MDVHDRSIRSDVLTILAPQNPETASAAAPVPSTTPSFADSLQRVQGNSPPPDVPRGKPRPTADANNRPAKPTATDAAPDDAPVDPVSTGAAGSNPGVARTSTVTANSAAEPAADSTPLQITAGDSKNGSHDDQPSSIAVDNLVADLMAGTALLPTIAPPNAVPVEKPVAAPVSLIKALVPTVEAPASAPTTVAAPALPSIPAGLQAGLAAPALPPAAVFPAAAGSATDDAVKTDTIPLAAPTDPATIGTAANSAVQASSHTSPLVIPAGTINGHPTSTAPTALTPAIVNSTLLASATTDTTESAPPATADVQLNAAAVHSKAVPSTRDAKTEPAETTPVTAETSRPALTAAVNALAAPAEPQGKTAPAKTSSVAATSAPISTEDRRLRDDVPSSVGTFVTGRDTASTAPIVDTNAAATLPGPNSTVPSIIEQLHPALHHAAAEDRQLTMTLRPAELGAVRIEITRHEGQLTARLHTETTPAHQLLTEHLPQLRELLTPLGVSADQVQILRSESTMENGNPTGSRTDGQSDARNAGGRQESEQRRPEPQLAEEPERDETASAGIRTRTALNLRI